jgi:outer membrane protein
METTAIGLPQITAGSGFQYTPTLSPTIKQFSGLGQLGSWMYAADQSLHNSDKTNPAFGYVPAPEPTITVSDADMKWSLSGTVTASQVIFSGSYLVALQSVKVYKSLSDLNWAKSVQDVNESVKNCYFNVLIARENLSILDSTYKNLEKTLDDLREIGKQGLIDQIDVDQMELTVTNLKINLDLVTRLADIAEKYLKIQLGINIDNQIQLTDDLNKLIDQITFENLLAADFVLDNNIDYQMIETQVKTAELLVKLNKTNYLPTVAGFYQYYKEFNDNAFSFTPPHIIGASLSIPIFTSGSNSAKVSQAKIDLLKAQNSHDQLSGAIKLDFYNSKSQLIAAQDKYAANTKNLELAKKIYNNSLIKYKNGMISSSDLTQSQNQYLTVQSNYYISLQELISATSKMEKLLTSNVQQ